MRDIDVRRALFRGELQRFKHDGTSRVVEELSLCQGDARIDIAVVNGKLHGFEIKSESDTLERLENQVSVYSKIFDHLTLVVGEAHFEKSLQIVPNWWGINLVTEKNKILRIKKIRRPKQNKSIDALSVVQLLWKDECLSLLAEFGVNKGTASKPKSWLWNRLVREVESRSLCTHVREIIKKRTQWRESTQIQRPCIRQSQCITYVCPLVEIL